MVLPPLLLALVGIEFELFPDFIDPMLLGAAQSISSYVQPTEISRSYSLQNMLSATGISAMIAILLFVSWDRIHDRLARMHWLDRYGPESSYALILTAIKKTAATHTRSLQSGRLDLYLRMTLTALILMALYLAWQIPQYSFRAGEWPPHHWTWWVAGGLMGSGAIAAVFLQNRLALLMAVGLIGYGSAVLFLFAGAPDLAFTQFIAETVLVVIAAAVIPFFKTTPYCEKLWAQPLSVMLALTAGIGTFLLLMNLQSFPENRELAEWFSANSLPLAYGRNVVNVIIVDFRALDTLGEIAVVAVSLLAAKPLFKLIRIKQPVPPSDSVLPDKEAVPLYWIMLTGALWILLRGHNEPGGGFIGGLIAVAASSQLAILHDTRLARKYQLLKPTGLAVLGVALALTAGTFGLISGEGFLRHVAIGGLSSVIVFDLGVFFAVWGSFSGYIYALLDKQRPGVVSAEKGGAS